MTDAISRSVRSLLAKGLIRDFGERAVDGEIVWVAKNRPRVRGVIVPGRPIPAATRQRRGSK